MVFPAIVRIDIYLLLQVIEMHIHNIILFLWDDLF